MSDHFTMEEMRELSASFPGAAKTLAEKRGVTPGLIEAGEILRAEALAVAASSWSTEAKGELALSLDNCLEKIRDRCVAVALERYEGEVQ